MEKLKKLTKREITMRVIFDDAQSVLNMCHLERKLEREKILKLIDEWWRDTINISMTSTRLEKLKEKITENDN